MAEIHIAKQLVAARHKKKITQEELASYIGVSKAAVSKWESGTSFPDITLLPLLATYYNISIDELMGYEPQMTREEIRRTYHELKKKFAKQSWEEAYAACAEIEKKYYSCFPLLLQMIVLYLNHAMLGSDPQSVYVHCVELADRISDLSEDVDDAKEAFNLKIACLLLMGEPMRALDLMDKQMVRPMFQDTELLAQVYQSTGNVDKAKEVYQIGLYQHLLQLISDMSACLILYGTDAARTEEITRRTDMMIEAFQVEKLHPNTAAIYYLTVAQTWIQCQKTDETLAYLEKYCYVCEHCFFPLTLHGDDFFDAIDGWFQDFDLGDQAPRSESLIRESMISSVRDNPVFEGLHSNVRYREVVKRLKQISFLPI